MDFLILNPRGFLPGHILIALINKSVFPYIKHLCLGSWRIPTRLLWTWCLNSFVFSFKCFLQLKKTSVLWKQFPFEVSSLAMTEGATGQISILKGPDQYLPLACSPPELGPGNPCSGSGQLYPCVSGKPSIAAGVAPSRDSLIQCPGSFKDCNLKMDLGELIALERSGSLCNYGED